MCVLCVSYTDIHILNFGVLEIMYGREGNRMPAYRGPGAFVVGVLCSFCVLPWCGVLSCCVCVAIVCVWYVFFLCLVCVCCSCLCLLLLSWWGDFVVVCHVLLSCVAVVLCGDMSR